MNSKRQKRLKDVQRSSYSWTSKDAGFVRVFFCSHWGILPSSFWAVCPCYTAHQLVAFALVHSCWFVNLWHVTMLLLLFSLYVYISEFVFMKFPKRIQLVCLNRQTLIWSNSQGLWQHLVQCAHNKFVRDVRKMQELPTKSVTLRCAQN